MQHTYLRYEAADSFGLVSSVGAASSTRAPPSDATLALIEVNHRHKNTTALLTTAGSYCTAWNLATGLPLAKLGHADYSGIGTGKALNASQVQCLDVVVAGADAAGEEPTAVVATGWIDGAVRVFEVPTSDLNSGDASFSLLGDKERPDPLVLNGHTPSPVTAISLEKNTNTQQQQQRQSQATASRLASGGSDGTVIVWDLVAESGLFRLLGHQGAITQLHFLNSLAELQDALITTSLDGLVKVWDLAAQCCVQTIANLRGEIWASQFLSIADKMRVTDEEQSQRHRFLAGSIDGQVRVWDVRPAARTTEEKDEEKKESTEEPHITSGNKDDICHDMGFLDSPQHIATSSSKLDSSAIHSKEKVLSIRYSPYSRHVGILQANSKNIHIYSIRSVKESQRKRQRRLKRRQEKQHKKEKTASEDKGGKKRGILDDDVEEENEQDTNQQQQQLQSYDPEQMRASDEFEYCGSIKATHKIKSFTFVPPQDKKANKKSAGTTSSTTLLRVACALSTNTLELYSLQKDTKTANSVPQSERISNLTPLHGHPTGVRAIALSSNDEMAITVSKNTCKLWNIAHRSCLQSLTLEKPVPVTAGQKASVNSTSYQGLCAAFLPGNNHVVVGTKEGHLLILDTAASEVVYWEEKAHNDAIWSLDITFTKPTSVDSGMQVTIVTGSADKKVKFWSVERQGEDDEEDEEDVFFPGAPMVVPTRVLEMTDEVVAVKYSHANFNNERRRMVFVSTLDCTIKVFFDDSLKLFLSLYGHKLPALACDASDDDMLLVSASADKTIKIWGLDFGDTHKTLHGHTDSVTDVQFVRGTHNFFSSSKDGTVRYWDGDRFEMVMVLRGHNAEVNCVAVSVHNNGAFCLSGSMDRQVRVWERTKDIVFLEEERERELEQMFDEPSNQRRDEGGTASILDRKGKSDDADGQDADDEMKQDEPQSEAAVKQSVLSIAAGDRLLEALELADQELQNSRGKSKASATSNPMLLGMEPAQYVLWVLRTIKSAELEQALLILPLSHTERLLYYLVLLLRSGHGAVELCCRVAVFTVKTHQHQVRHTRTFYFG